MKEGLCFPEEFLGDTRRSGRHFPTLNSHKSQLAGAGNVKIDDIGLLSQRLLRIFKSAEEQGITTNEAADGLAEDRLKQARAS